MISIVFILMVLFPFNVFAADSYVVADGDTQIVDEHGVCKQITNNHSSGLSIFVPTRTAEEWSVGGSAFLNNLPANIVAGDCPALCGGVEVDGYCWYYAEYHNQSCTDLCSTRGGYNEATRTHVGVPGRSAECFKVADALGVGGSNVASGTTCALNAARLGCHTYHFSPTSPPYFRFFCPNADAQPDATSGNNNDGRFRICACNQ